MRNWVLLLLVLLFLTSANYYDDHPKWAKCSFWIDSWQLGYDYCMLVMVITWLYATATASRSDQHRIRLKPVFTAVFPGIQAVQLVYIVWGTYRIAKVMENEPECVIFTQLPIATWRVWTEVISVYVSWLVLSVFICALVSPTQAIIFAYYSPMLGLAPNDFQAQIQVESGLSQDLIDHIRDIEGNTAEMCSICLENFTAGMLVKRLPTCGHQFHKNCIELWLLRSKICPFCKQEITERAIREEM
jgi:hypothetical protein